MAEMNGLQLEVKSVDIGYGAKQVLHQAQLSIRAGGVHLLIGRNGTGKSSLLRSIAGLQPIQAGSIVLDGKNVHELSAVVRAKSLAYVASTPPRTSQLCVEEVLGLAASNAANIPRVLEHFGHLSWAPRRLDTLSDGEAQRVMFARAVLQDTPWIFMDEPMAFLDVPSRKAFWNHAVEVTEQGTTIFLASHDYEQLAKSVSIASAHLIEAKGIVPLDPRESPQKWTKRMES